MTEEALTSFIVCDSYHYWLLTKLNNDKLSSVKDADLLNHVVLASVIHVRTVCVVPFNHWPLVQCGLQICGTHSR